jgi:hypothetical protein
VLLKFLRISENSLYPRYQDGEYVLVSKLPILVRGIRPGDVIVFEQPHLGKLIKLVDHVEGDGHLLYVLGLAPESVDSRSFGLVPSERVLGKVIRHFPKKST